MKLKLKNIFRRKRPASGIDTRMFQAAAHNRLIDWTVSYQRVNGDLFLQYQTIVLRCRDLAMNNESVIGLLRNLTRNVIGASGFTLQSKANTPELRPQIEKLWREYCSRSASAVTMDERSSARDLDILILRSLIIDGECFIHKVYDPTSRFGWRYEVIDSLQIDPFYMVERLENGGYVFMGIEFDSRGREVAYYYRPTVCEQYMTGPRERIPAENIIHLYRKEFPAQMRGIPALAGAVLNLKQLDDYRTAELVHAQIGSCCMGVWVWNGQNAEDIITCDTEQDKGEFIREIKPGIFPIAPRGYEPKFLQNPGTNTQFPSFVKSVLRSICNSIGISYNKGSGDYESVNYSSLREANLEDRETFMELQRFMIESWKTAQFNDFIRSAVLNGLIVADTFASVSRHQFFGRRFSWVDPAKEIRAKKDELALMLTDPISEIEARGEDPDELIERFAIWRDKLKARGLEAFWDSAFTKLPDTIEEVDAPEDESNTNQSASEAEQTSAVKESSL
jgi:lambda family phage portal protein